MIRQLSLKKCIDRILINASCLIQCIIINEQSWEYWHDIQNVYNDYKQLNSYQILVTGVNSSYYTIHTGPKDYHNIPFYGTIFDTFYYDFITITMRTSQINSYQAAEPRKSYVFDTVIWLNKIVFNLFDFLLIYLNF